MKLVIDISEEDYEYIKNSNDMNFNVIKNGTPLKEELKKMKTKIDALPTMSCNSIGCSYMLAKDYKIDVLSILDKSIEDNK